MKTLTIPGGVAGPVSACSAGPSRVDAFAPASNGTIWRWAFDGANQAMTSLPDQGTVAIGSGVVAVSSAPNRIEVFAVDAYARTPIWWRATGTSFSPAGLLPAGANLPAVPVAVVCSSPDNIDVFAAGAFNTPWWWHWNGGTWTAPVALPGGDIPAVRVAAVSPTPGRLDVFAIGRDKQLWHWSKASTSVTWALTPLGGNLPAEGVCAVSWGTNRLDVFAPTPDGNTLSHWASDGAGWARDLLGSDFAPGTVGAVSHAPNRLDVFGISGRNQLSHMQWDGHVWSGPAARGQNIPGGDVTAVVRAPHRVDVFLVGAGNTLLRWPGGGLENSTALSWKNWPENRALYPVGHVWPDSLEELVNVVKEAERLGRGVRAVGSSWSNSDVAVSPGYVVETDRLGGIVTDVVDTSLNALGASLSIVHVEAGMKLDALNHNLDARGLAIKTMGGSSGQSVAGVLSTSARGMDIDRGPIPDMVRAIHLVGPGGAQHWIEPSEPITNRNALRACLGIPDENIHYDDDWFNSALVSVGSLGVIYSLIAEVVPQYDLVETREALEWGAMKARLRGGSPNPFTGNRGVEIVVDVYPRADGTRPTYLLTRTERRPATIARGTDGWCKTLFSALAASLILTNRSLVPNVVSTVTRANLDIPARGPGIGHTVMGRPDPGSVKALTIAVVFEAWASTKYLDFVDAALKLLTEAFNLEPGQPSYLGYCSLRYQSHSRAYLSPCHGAELTCLIEFAAIWGVPHVGLTWGDTPGLLTRIETEARKFGGIQHWGMHDDLRVTDVGRAYPRLDTWHRVRWQLTNGGGITTFDSDFTRRAGLARPPQLRAATRFDADRRADFAVWRPDSGTWFVVDSATGRQRTAQLGEPGDIPVPGDYDGDGKIDFAVFRPRTGEFIISETSKNSIRKQRWGEATDVPVPGDYNGTGKTELAVWRPRNGTWMTIAANGYLRQQQWGEATDIPVPGDYDGDGKTDFAVWRPRTGEWFVIDSGTGVGRSRQWGEPTDIPVPGDYDGDGKTDFAVWRPRTGEWFVIDSSTGRQHSHRWSYTADVAFAGTTSTVTAGATIGFRPGLVPGVVPGPSTPPPPPSPGFVPVPGDFDGDGKTDFVLWDPNSGTWYVTDSSTGATRTQQWGQSGDIPV